MAEDDAGGATSTGRCSGNSDGDGLLREQSAEDVLIHEQISTDDMSTDGTAAGGPKDEGSSFSDYAYDPLAYVGVCPYPDSRGPLEHDPTPQAKYGREQAQLYSTAYYYDKRRMLTQGYRMKKNRDKCGRPQCVEEADKTMPKLSQLTRPPKPTKPDGGSDGFKFWDNCTEFENYITPLLYGSFPEGQSWKLTSNYVSKLWHLNNEFFRLRKEGIIEAVTTLRPLQPHAGGAHSATLDSSLSEGGNGGASAMMHIDRGEGKDPHDRSIFGFSTMLVKQPIFHERISALVKEKFKMRYSTRPARSSSSPEPQNENPKGKGGGKEEDGPRKKRKVGKTRGGRASGGGGGGRQGNYPSDTMITPTNLPAGPCSSSGLHVENQLPDSTFLNQDLDQELEDFKETIQGLHQDHGNSPRPQQNNQHQQRKDKFRGK